MFQYFSGFIEIILFIFLLDQFYYIIRLKFPVKRTIFQDMINREEIYQKIAQAFQDKAYLKVAVQYLQHITITFVQVGYWITIIIAFLIGLFYMLIVLQWLVLSAVVNTIFRNVFFWL